MHITKLIWPLNKKKTVYDKFYGWPQNKYAFPNIAVGMYRNFLQTKMERSQKLTEDENNEELPEKYCDHAVFIKEEDPEFR